MSEKMTRLWRILLLSTIIVGLAACQSRVADDDTVSPTVAATLVAVRATEVSETEVETAVVPVPATWTPAPTEPAPPTSTPLPTVTVAPTDTPTTVPTNTPPPTETPTPTDTPVPPTNTPAPTSPPAAPTSPPAAPTVPPNPVLGVNLLPNSGFEEGWYNKDGIPELQLPNSWAFDWDTGPTGFGSESWDVYVRPETRVLPAAQLPPAEHPLFIYDGSYTVKIFKGSGAISFRMYTEVTLEPGTYLFEVNVFPDQVMGYNNGQKIWADDPRAGELRLWAGDRSTDWLSLTYGQRNTRNYTFTIDQTQTIRVGIWGRGRYALPNNGFFFDAFSLQRVEG